jgi:putative peptide zinc metalloprotease protein
MAVLPSAPTGRDDPSGSSRPVASAPGTDRLCRADGVELIGEMVGSGYREAPSLARRADGQTIQLTGLLYLVLESVDGRRGYAEVAQRVSERFGRTVTESNVRTLVDGQLRPMGLLTLADGSQPDVKKSNPLLALRFKYAVSDPERTRRLTTPFARLFNPLLVVAVMAAFVAVCWWVFMEKGLASATYEAFDSPGLLLLVVAVTVLSAGFHEFGHAAAARRGGATPGVMGAGIYLVWPAFFTDVTDSYRLGRGGRVRTDLGGLYFNAIVAVAIAGVWWATGYDALLLVVATQILQMLHQMTPLVRFDGYHVLADVTGVPDLFHRIKPTLLGLLPWRWRHPEATVLKPWARAVVSVWVLVVVPMLAFSLFTMVITLPRILGTAWVSMLKQGTLLGRAWGDADVLEVAARAIAVVAVVFPVLAIGFILVRLGRSIALKVWRGTRGRPVRRGLAAVVAASLVGGLAYAWWPHDGSYRPIQPYEGGTLTQAVGAIPVNRAAPTGLREGQYGHLVTGWADGDARPTAAHPQLALVLVPHGTSTTPGGVVDTPSGGSSGSSGSAGQPWVFPFNKPLAPGDGDNQAMAVNTRDATIQYDVAFALVWVTDDSPALNRNEAYAFADCTGCAAVSVAFQVVLVTGDNHVAAPQNISAAVNYDCVNCLSYALATQLFVTLDGPLSDAGQQQIAALWAEIAQFGTHITEVPLSEIRSRLSSYEQQILAVIEKEQGPLTDQPSASPSDQASASPSDGSTAEAGATDAGSPSAQATPGDTASSSPSSPDGSGGSGGSGGTGSTGSTSGGTTQDSPATDAPASSAAPSDAAASSDPSPAAADATP